jgi:hypothetical protein
MTDAQAARRKAALFLQMARQRDGREAELLAMLAAENLERAEQAEQRLKSGASKSA